MGSLDLPQSPNVFHPEKPSAVGSRNSLAQDYRDQQKEVNHLIEEETNKVLHHLSTKLPKDVLERLDVMGGLKEKLYNYFNQNYQNMFNRYMVTAEDEMLKKVRGFIDREEMKVLNRYTPKEIATLLDEVGGGYGGEAGVETQHPDGVEAAGVAQQAQLFAQGAEAEGFFRAALPAEKFLRLGFEYDGHGGKAALVGFMAQAFEDMAVAEVDTVEREGRIKASGAVRAEEGYLKLWDCRKVVC